MLQLFPNDASRRPGQRPEWRIGYDDGDAEDLDAEQVHMVLGSSGRGGADETAPPLLQLPPPVGARQHASTAAMWPPAAGCAAVSSVASNPRCVHSTVHSSSPRSLMDQVFEEGDIVEVESTERGFEGSRAKATLLAALPGGHWRVRYVDFKDAVGRHPLLGEVHEKYLRPPPPKPPPGAAEWVPGVGAPPRPIRRAQPLGMRHVILCS